MTGDLIDTAGAGRLETVQRLPRDGADVNGRDHRGRTAVTAAAINQHIDVVRALVDAGADVDLQDEDRNNPLLLSGENGNVARLHRDRGHARAGRRPLSHAVDPRRLRNRAGSHPADGVRSTTAR